MMEFTKNQRIESMMIGVYFSGTGNSKYCISKFMSEYGGEASVVSIEEETAIIEVQKYEKIVFCYPVQYSNLPKILMDFVNNNSSLWKNKKIFVIATMGLFSGDGSGVLARLLKRHGAVIIGGLHLKMPDSICDERVLKRSLENNRKLIRNAEIKIKGAVQRLQDGKPTQEGIGFLYHLAGLFGQRLYFYNKTKYYSDQLKIDKDRCIGCGKCIQLCPMKNIEFSNGAVVANNLCTMCYRCISQCPLQAITLLGKNVIEQCCIERYMRE